MTDANKAAAPAEAKEIKFKQDLLDISAKVKPLFATDATAGSLTLPEGNFFDLFPHITPESYDAHANAIDLYSNGVTHAATEAAIPLYVANKELQTVTVTAPIHNKDSYEAVLKRSGQSRNPGNGVVTDYVGSVSVARVNVVSTRSKAESSNIKANFRSMAEAAGL